VLQLALALTLDLPLTLTRAMPLSHAAAAIGGGKRTARGARTRASQSARKADPLEGVSAGSDTVLATGSQPGSGSPAG